jgi:hypothetical protein
VNATTLDRRPGLGPALARVALPFGGVALWAVHLAACYSAVELLVRADAAADEILGMRADVFIVAVITLLAAIPTVALIVVSRRRIPAGPEEVDGFARSFCTWLNVVMLFAIVLEGLVIVFVVPR